MKRITTIALAGCLALVGFAPMAGATVCDTDPDAVDFTATVNPTLLNNLLGTLGNIELDSTFGPFSVSLLFQHDITVDLNSSIPISGSTPFVVTPTLGQIDVTLSLGAWATTLGINVTNETCDDSCDIYDVICWGEFAACEAENAVVNGILDGTEGGLSFDNGSAITQTADTCVLGDCTAVHPLVGTSANLVNFTIQLFPSGWFGDFLNDVLTSVIDFFVDIEDTIGDFFESNGEGILINVFHGDIINDGCAAIPEVIACQQGGGATIAGLPRAPHSGGLNALFYALPLMVMGGAAWRVRRRF